MCWYVCIDAYILRNIEQCVDILWNWPNRRCQLQLLPAPRFAFRDAFSNVSLHHRPPFSTLLSLSLSLSPSVSRPRVVNFRRYNDRVVNLPIEFDIS